MHFLKPVLHRAGQCSAQGKSNMTMNQEGYKIDGEDTQCELPCTKAVLNKGVLLNMHVKTTVIRFLLYILYIYPSKDVEVIDVYLLVAGTETNQSLGRQFRYKMMVFNSKSTAAVHNRSNYLVILNPKQGQRADTTKTKYHSMYLLFLYVSIYFVSSLMCKKNRVYLNLTLILAVTYLLYKNSLLFIISIFAVNHMLQIFLEKKCLQTVDCRVNIDCRCKKIP